MGPWQVRSAGPTPPIEDAWPNQLSAPIYPDIRKPSRNPNGTDADRRYPPTKPKILPLLVDGQVNLVPVTFPLNSALFGSLNCAAAKHAVFDLHQCDRVARLPRQDIGVSWHPRMSGPTSTRQPCEFGESLKNSWFLASFFRHTPVD